MRLDRTTFSEHLERRGLIARGARVAVAVSGGRDSVALLHLLVGLRREWPLDLIAVHLDHRMRVGSEADASWVAGLCRAWSVPLVAACARLAPRSEAEARALRYDLFRSVARICRVAAVTTAHHADDQAETVLMRIARGTGVRGLRGIAERRGRLVRPLLVFDRSAIDEYLAREGLRWREDASNADPRFTRNRVRATLMPALGREAAGALAALAGRADSLEASRRARPADAAAIARPTERGFAIARAPLLGYDPAARARLLRELCSRLGVVPTRPATEAAVAFMERGVSGSGLDLGGGVRLGRELSELRLERDRQDPPEDEPLRIETTAGRGRVVVGGRALAVEWAPASGEPAVGSPAGTPPSTDTVVVGTAGLPLELRPWQPGDRMRLRAGSRKLKKLFNDWRIERPERARLPVLADASGRILWVAGRVAAVDAATAGEPLLRISVRDAELE